MYHRKIMKKVVVAGLVAVPFVLLLVWVGGRLAALRSEGRPWPRNLGSLRDVPRRYPPTGQSPAATELIRLAAAADVNITPGLRGAKPDEKVRAALADFIRAEIERPGDAIGPSLPLAAQYLARYESQFDAVRDHLLSGEPIVWRSNFGADDPPIPNLLGHLTLARVFTARALEKARAGDAAAWDELQAAWEVARPLWKRPEPVTVLIALAASRMVNAAARKMPEPNAPAWFDEFRAVDVTGAMIAAQQADASLISEFSSRVETQTRPHPIVRLFMRIPATRQIDAMRDYAAAVDRSGVCDAAALPKPPVNAPNLTGAFHRVLRYRAEVEATTRVLQLRRGETPSSQSQCSDGTWIVTPNGFRFSRDIKVEPPGHRIPLIYELTPAQTPRQST